MGKARPTLKAIIETFLMWILGQIIVMTPFYYTQISINLVLTSFGIYGACVHILCVCTQQSTYRTFPVASLQH